MSVRRFEIVEGSSSKFWEIAVEGSAVTVRFGKIGTAGQAKTRDLGSAAAAASDAAKLVAEKTKKGYAETGGTARSDAPTIPPPARSSTQASDRGGDQIAALRSDGASDLRDGIGELRILEEGEEPDIVGSFRLLPDEGDAWATVLEGIEWLFEEADGGCVGRYRSGPAAFLYLDNEGSFHASPTLVDHLASRDYSDEYADQLAAHCKEHGLAPPLAKAAREKASRALPKPEKLLVEVQKQAAKAEKAKAKAAKVTATVALADRQRRPLARFVDVGLAADGTIYLHCREDWGAPDSSTRKGATFRIDTATPTFVSLGSRPAGTSGPMWDGFAEPWGCFPFAPEKCLASDGTWLSKGGVDLPESHRRAFHCHRLADGSTLLFSNRTSCAIYRFDGATMAHLGDLPEPRHDDRLIELGGGRVLLLGGKTEQGDYFLPSAKTVILDLASGAVSPGADLPHRGTLGLDRRGRAFIIDDGNPSSPKRTTPRLFTFDGADWSAHAMPPELVDLPRNTTLEPVCALSSGLVLLKHRYDALLYTFDVGTREVKAVGEARAQQDSARVFELPDGRVLFVGGSLYNNNDAEPEIWDPATNGTTCLPGYEKEIAKQARELAKHREREAKRGG